MKQRILKNKGPCDRCYVSLINPVTLFFLLFIEVAQMSIGLFSLETLVKRASFILITLSSSFLQESSSLHHPLPVYISKVGFDIINFFSC